MIRSNLCNYSDLYILVKGTVGMAAAGTTVNNTKN